MGDHIEGMNTFTGTFGASDTIQKMRGVGCPATITVVPGSGCTVKVQATTSSEAAVDASTATWVDWDTGAVTATTQRSLVSPVTALKFVRTAGAVESSYEVSV